MGSWIDGIWKSRVKRRWKVAFFSACILGLLVHLYKFTNSFPYFDTLYNYYSSQNMLGHGRWLLSAACAMTSYFDLPWLNGLASVFLMGLTAAVVADVLDMENPYLIVVSSGLLVSYPAITETMFFEYAADGYMLAMLLSALAVRFSTMEHIRSGKHLLLSAACICMSCGIYQAYLSFALVLAICYFLEVLLDSHWEQSKCLRWIGFQAGAYVLGLAAYYGIWQLTLAVNGLHALDYQGISQAGAVGLNTIILGFRQSLVSFLLLLIEQNPLRYGLTLYAVLNIGVVLVFLAGIVMGILRAGLHRQKLRLLLAVICLAALPLACYIFYFVSPGVTYFTRMLQSVALLYLFTGVLWQREGGKAAKEIVFLLLAAVVWNQTVMANVCYLYLDRSYEQSYADAQEMATRIHMEDDGTVKYVAFVGFLDTISEEDYQDDAKLGTLGPLKLVYKAELRYDEHIILFMRQYLDFTLGYYRETGEPMPLMELEASAPVPKGTEIPFPIVSRQKAQELSVSPQVAQMAVWPERDSVRRIGDTIVVKLSEP